MQFVAHTTLGPVAGRLLARLAIERHGVVPPEEDTTEPARTERALRRAFLWTPRWPWRCSSKEGVRAGDVLECLPMWTDDANIVNNHDTKKNVFAHNLKSQSNPLP